ncbi:MAG: hydrogenase formation protein HypD [Candidatus Omnitrophota bacterium]
MKYIDEYRDKKRVLAVADKIKMIMPAQPINIMEVCGTHTQSFYRFGLDKLVPPNLKLISGPGCPVCVSSEEYIDTAIKLAGNKKVIIATFGDMLRVPGRKSSLEKERAKSGNIQVVYSPLDALKVAEQNPAKKIVFLAVGFETTAPTIALTILKARDDRIKNLFFLTSLKLIPPAMETLLKDRRIRLNGFLCPGHVSAIIGTGAYLGLSKKYGISCCVAGFEPLDILEGLYLLLGQIIQKRHYVQNQYFRVVTASGNRRAQGIIKKVFTVEDVSWRGLGIIAESGLGIKKGFTAFSARKEFSLKTAPQVLRGLQKKCKCGDVLKGIMSPDQCVLFRRACTPTNPYGPCMVSTEGACNAYYRYN